VHHITGHLKIMFKIKNKNISHQFLTKIKTNALFKYVDTGSSQCIAFRCGGSVCEILFLVLFRLHQAPSTTPNPISV
jgi:hypothetical protein